MLPLIPQPVRRAQSPPSMGLLRPMELSRLSPDGLMFLLVKYMLFPVILDCPGEMAQVAQIIIKYPITRQIWTLLWVDMWDKPGPVMRMALCGPVLQRDLEETVIQSMRICPGLLNTLPQTQLVLKEHLLATPLDPVVSLVSLRNNLLKEGHIRLVAQPLRMD